MRYRSVNVCSVACNLLDLQNDVVSSSLLSSKGSRSKVSCVIFGSKLYVFLA